ncbi:LexA family transcriptional regulator [Thiobacillus sp.]|uniref:LexA family protein n=1 Tax=Thiobacillus sp. TaxID=924 RepID=UPI0025EFFDC8|nr:translesion error-prone DNA polymerase V autoproteolytic subunit [Thiobacillus sp.]MBT9540223.1 translesion error-prone DNA polymerase V autoproteolytic subunit [Thiobacillus sp.]
MPSDHLPARGGRRPGAGRPAKEPTRVIRLPERLLPLVTQLAAIGPGQGLPPGAWALDNHGQPLALPFFATPVRAGFPSPADDHQEDRLDLNHHLVRHPEATYYLRAKGDSMTGAGIHDGDLLMVDRAIEAAPGMIVVAAVDNEFTVKLLESTPNGLCLAPANPDYPKIVLKDAQELTLWGVVIHVIHPVFPRG